MADLTSAQWQALAQQFAADTDRLGHAFALELADILQRVERRLPPLITRATDGEAAATLKAAHLGELRASLRRLLREAGYEDLVDASMTAGLDQSLSRLATINAAYRRAVRMQTAGRPSALVITLRAAVEVGRLDLLAHGDTIADTLWRATMRGVLGADTPDAIVAQLTHVLDGQRARAASLYDTNVSIVQRVSVQTIAPVVQPTVRGATPSGPPLATGGDVLAAPDGQLYAFVGPVDGLMRPFCRAHVGRVYTRAEIEALDNGQLPNPFLTGGGYNCRHLWAPISRFDPAADLHGTGGRVEEVGTALLRARRLPARRRKAT